MVVINEIFSFTHPLTIYLQGKIVDLASAVSTAEDLIKLLKNVRENASSEFKKVFVAAEEIADAIGVKIEAPRVVPHQKHRENYQSNSSEDYFRKSVFIPFVDHFISALNDRFVKHKRTLSIIQNIIPDKLVKLCSINGYEDDKLINNEISNIISETVEAILKQWLTFTTSNESIIKNFFYYGFIMEATLVRSRKTSMHIYRCVKLL